MNLTSFRTLFAQTCSYEACSQIRDEAATLYREDHPSRWYFLLLNRIFAQLVDNPELHDADRAEPTLAVIYDEAVNGIDAIEQSDMEKLIASANGLTEAYCGMP
jgi:hypothetical protein